MPEVQQTWFVRSPSVLWRVVGTEVVAMTPEGEEAFNLSPTAAAVWLALEGARTLPALVEELARSFRAPQEEIEEGVTSLLEDFIGRGMVEAGADGDD